jgi:hypothetical protein
MYQSEGYEESVLLHRMIIVHQSDLHCNVSAAHIARIIAEIHGLWVYVQFVHTIQVDVLAVFIQSEFSHFSYQLEIESINGVLHIQYITSDAEGDSGNGITGWRAGSTLPLSSFFLSTLSI